MQATEDKRKAEDISAVLYPNDATEYGRELRLKQQIFFVSAAIQVKIIDTISVAGAWLCLWRTMAQQTMQYGKGILLTAGAEGIDSLNQDFAFSNFSDAY